MKFTLSNLGKWTIAQCLFLFGIVRQARKAALKKEHVLAVYFHNPTKWEFESSVRWLTSKQFSFISPDDLLLISQKKRSFPKGAVLLTVDDGWKSNEENIVDVANEYKVPVTIFVSTDPVENGNYWWPKVLKLPKNSSFNIPSVQQLKKVPNDERINLINKIPPIKEREAMDIQQIKRISKSEFVHIGAHTHTHPILPNCTYEQVYEELHLSKQKLEEWTGKNVISFAYPNGDYTQREINLLRELNYQMAFTCEPAGITSSTLALPFQIPRFAFLEGASMAENICRIMGIWQPLRDKFRGKLFDRSVNYREYKYQNNSA